MAKTELPGTPRPSWLSRWGQAHLRVFFFSLGKLWAKPVGTLLTAAVIGITLALPAGLHVLLKNVSAISHSWEGTVHASLFLRDSVNAARGETLSRELAARPGVGSSRYISRESALAEFRALSGFAEALDVLDDNPLPAVIVITPERGLDKNRVAALVDELGRLPEVELAKLDQKWLERLYAILDILSRVVLLIAGVLALAVVVTVGNTIRLDIENRREEIVVMKLIGAPDSFIRRPFLYTGFWYGLTGGLIAWLLVNIALLTLAGPATYLASLYQSSFRFSGLGLEATGLMLGAGVLLGWLGAFWTVSRHLAEIEPA
jgi:cell division transport system permease protein